MSYRALVALVSCSVVTACAERELDPDVKAAYDSFVAAVKARDAGRLYELSPKELHDRMEALHAELTSVVARVLADYPKSGRDDALAALGPVSVRNAADARELFISLVDFDAVESSAAADRGLEIENLTVDGDKATVHTRGKEAFLFVKSDRGWQCTALLVQLDAYSSLKQLRANIQAAGTNLDRLERATTENRDVRSPEGVFNVVVEAVRRGRRVQVYEFLDQQSLDHLAAGMKVVTNLQQATEKRYPKREERRSFLESRQIGWVERVANEKSLFATLWDVGKLARTLPFTGKVKVDKVELRGESSAAVFATTDDGEGTFLVERTPSGLWKAAWIEPVIQREALHNLEAVLRALEADAPK